MSENQLELEEKTEDTVHGRFLTFGIGQEVFGIKIRVVREIIGMQPINTLPEVPDYIRGIINLRGKIIPVIDMRIKFHKEPTPYTDRTCIVVIDTQEMVVGLIVDRVAEVISIKEENIVPPPDQKTGMHNTYIQGIGKVDDNVKLLLDCESLLDGDDDRDA